MTSQLETNAPPSPAYPIAYFLCDGVTDARTLKTALSLSRTPKLRKARIAGYRRSIRAGDGASTLAYDAHHFGEWSGEEVVKGVVFEALCLEEERDLIKYVGGTGEVKAVHMEVACPSLLGKVGKMMTVGGRIFVPEGDGDKLVGNMRSFVNGEGRLEPEEMDTVVRNDRWAEGSIMEQEFDDGDFSERGSITIVERHLIPRISSSIATLDDADIPHQSLDELPSAAVGEHLEPQAHEHPAEYQIETKDWTATSEVETMVSKDIKGTEIYKELMEMQESSKIEVVEEAGEVETTPIRDIQDIKVFKAIMKTEEPVNMEAAAEARETAEGSNGTEEIDDGRNTQVETEYQRFLLAEHRRSRAVSMNTFISGTSTTIDEEGSAATPTTQPWAPTTPWRKEHAAAPVRPVLTAKSPSQSIGTTTRMRKTSDSIKSLVEKFENMSPQNLPGKSA
ncbi:hypothetical protein G6011_11623 [Alternaria panax]|uniref:Uncharacterized protein n=1 Tax=Alternaria panax TaxID=48097 RepID=A0AAD4IE54_9PLEO|nr:hypothetical protein G6011_11623 [Alternaria panax]